MQRRKNFWDMDCFGNYRNKKLSPSPGGSFLFLNKKEPPMRMISAAAQVGGILESFQKYDTKWLISCK